MSARFQYLSQMIKLLILVSWKNNLNNLNNPTFCLGLPTRADGSICFVQSHLLEKEANTQWPQSVADGVIGPG